MLGNEDIAKDMRQKRRLKVSILNIEAKTKKKKIVSTGTAKPMDDLEAVITNGPYFDILNPDSYIELDVHMACDLNMDWFIYENYKYYCCLLLAGAILLDGEKGILINTIEVYGRTSLIDPYYERFLNGKEAITKTLLPSTGLIYNDVFVTVKKEDGSRKLIIATKSMNALVTSSIRIDQEVLPEVGSSTLQFMPSTNTRIYILSSQLYDAKKVYKLDTVKYLYPQDILSQLRQVRSKFIKNNGYLTLRASSPMTNYHNLDSQ